MPSNQDRVERLDTILSLCPDDQSTAVIDLLADTMHWCQQNGTDFESILFMARIHFDTETSPDSARQEKS